MKKIKYLIPTTCLSDVHVFEAKSWWRLWVHTHRAGVRSLLGWACHVCHIQFEVLKTQKPYRLFIHIEYKIYIFMENLIVCVFIGYSILLRSFVLSFYTWAPSGMGCFQNYTFLKVFWSFFLQQPIYLWWFTTFKIGFLHHIWWLSTFV
jgi:hypothetical protein